MLLTLALPLASCKKDDGDDPETPDNQQPQQPTDEWGTVLRFVVTSDLHLRATDYDYESYRMLQELYSTAYGYSEAQDYNKLDAIIFAGDFTENGKEAEMTKFFDFVKTNTKVGTTARAVLGNHEFYATRYDDGTTDDDRYSDTSVRNTYENFLRISGYSSVDAHLVVNGYHFIVLNNDRYALDYDGSKFSPQKLAWLETELQNAAAQDWRLSKSHRRRSD
jgi:3',5'-cyclic AMP phosphodiesterase CpdA